MRAQVAGVLLWVIYASYRAWEVRLKPTENCHSCCLSCSILSVKTCLQELFNKSEGISIWNYDTATKKRAAVLNLFQKNYTYEAVDPKSGSTKTFYAWAKLDCDDCYIAITGMGAQSSIVQCATLKMADIAYAGMRILSACCSQPTLNLLPADADAALFMSFDYSLTAGIKLINARFDAGLKAKAGLKVDLG